MEVLAKFVIKKKNEMKNCSSVLCRVFIKEGFISCFLVINIKDDNVVRKCHQQKTNHPHCNPPHPPSNMPHEHYKNRCRKELHLKRLYHSKFM